MAKKKVTNKVTKKQNDNQFMGMGNPFNMQGTQLSQTDTLWKNLRWYLVSNMRNLLSQMYVEHGLVQTICRVPVEDALRGWIDIKSKQLSEEQLEELHSRMEYENDPMHANDAGTWMRLYGGGALLAVTGQDWEEPLDVEALHNEHLEFKAVDMWELFYSIANIEGDGEPLSYLNSEYFNYYGKLVHKSRVFILKGLEAPSFIRVRLRGWGMSVVEPLVRSINQYLKSTNLTFEVLDEFKIDVFRLKNLANTLLAANGEGKVARRVQAANQKKNYLNSIVLDSEDEYQQKQLSFSGLAEAQQGIKIQCAADMRMPMTKLFGISAAGFNSGEDDIEVYNAMVESEVRAKIKYPILRMVELRCAQLFGVIPDDLMIEFKPLRILSAEQEENVKTQKFNRLMMAKEKGLIDGQAFIDAVNHDNLLPIKIDADSIEEVLETNQDEEVRQPDQPAPEQEESEIRKERKKNAFFNALTEFFKESEK